ncbi:hypothetical protein SB6421_03240 [Klebsiella huaxiensis]|uniref:Uncharacterized protein n=1 Tax=Klebsiella huaxiensis TaxID=2153354 RepID=A0A564KUT8_9ENTR|nr:hypothetical protein SB6421_03240 [Klebsiella huaxiensis]VUS80790.1 hypothetical protein SB6422_02321 [Klebsiella huaxiensis]
MYIESSSRFKFMKVKNNFNEVLTPAKEEKTAFF